MRLRRTALAMRPLGAVEAHAERAVGLLTKALIPPERPGRRVEADHPHARVLPLRREDDAVTACLTRHPVREERRVGRERARAAWLAGVGDVVDDELVRRRDRHDPPLPDELRNAAPDVFRVLELEHRLERRLFTVESRE